MTVGVPVTLVVYSPWRTSPAPSRPRPTTVPGTGFAGRPGPGPVARAAPRRCRAGALRCFLSLAAALPHPVPGPVSSNTRARSPCPQPSWPASAARSPTPVTSSRLPSTARRPQCGPAAPAEVASPHQPPGRRPGRPQPSGGGDPAVAGTGVGVVASGVTWGRRWGSGSPGGGAVGSVGHVAMMPPDPAPKPPALDSHGTHSPARLYRPPRSAVTAVAASLNPRRAPARPATATGGPGARPSTRWSRRARRGRSPCRRPAPSRAHTRSSVARLPVRYLA